MLLAAPPALALHTCAHRCPPLAPQRQPVTQFVLFDSASGYGLFEVTEAEEIGALLPSVSGVAAAGGRCACSDMDGGTSMLT